MSSTFLEIDIGFHMERNTWSWQEKVYSKFVLLGKAFEEAPYCKVIYEIYINTKFTSYILQLQQISTVSQNISNKENTFFKPVRKVYTFRTKFTIEPNTLI